MDNKLSIYIFTVGRISKSPITVKLCMDTKTLEMEIDSSAAVSIISEQLHKRLPNKQVGPVLLCCLRIQLRKYHYLGRHNNYMLNVRDRRTHSLHILPNISIRM